MKNEQEYGEMLVNDPRLGKRIKALDVSKRFGYDVFGYLKGVRQFADGCEIWYVICDGGMGVDAHSINFELMDGQHGVPSGNLRQGEVTI